MPLIEIRQLSAHTRLGLWRMDDDTAQGAESPRQRERRNAQQLLEAMMGVEGGFTIGHEASGKPFVAARTPHADVKLKGWRISISHTMLPRVPMPEATAPVGYVAILLSKGYEVGVDIERRSDRVERIASRFIRPDEQAGTTERKLLLWSAKETVYKLFSEDHLQFSDMRATAVGTGLLRMENMKKNIAVDVCCEFTDGYVLTFAAIPAATTPGL